MRHFLPLPGAATVACACVLAAPAFAHHAGSAGNNGDSGPINTISATTLEQGEGLAGIVVSYGRFNTLSDATLVGATSAGIDDVHGLRSIESYALAGAYGLTNDLTLSAYLPYVRRTGIRAAEDNGSGVFEVEDHGEARDLGDLSLLGEYRFFNDPASRTEAALLLGFRAPTGRTGLNTRQGDIFDAEFQPGAGSWGGFFGLSLTHRVGSWSYDSSFLYELATTGTQHSDLGDQFLYNFAVSYRLNTISGAAVPMFHGGHSHEAGDDGHAHKGHQENEHTHDEASAGAAVDLVLELNGIWHDRQVTADVTNVNSGGNTLFISPGVRVSYGRVSSFVSFGIPIVDDLNGIQADSDWRLATGVTVGF